MKNITPFGEGAGDLARAIRAGIAKAKEEAMKKSSKPPAAQKLTKHSPFKGRGWCNEHGGYGEGELLVPHPRDQKKSVCLQCAAKLKKP